MKDFNKLNVEGRSNLCFWGLQKKLKEDPLAGKSKFAGDITNLDLLNTLEAAASFVDYCKFELGEDIDPKTDDHIKVEKALV